MGELIRAYAENFKEILSVEVLGKSVESREIWAVRITDHPHENREANEPSVKYIANMHGNEGCCRNSLNKKFATFRCFNFSCGSPADALTD